MNVLKHPVDVRQHIIVPVAQNAIALGLQKFRACGFSISSLGMLTTVHFNDKTRGMTCEIGDVTPESNLPSEMRIRRA